MSNPIIFKQTAIIGAGFGGIGMAARLLQSGIDDLVVLEKEAGVGGTWWVNRYPGAACDVPSHLYSFSFAPKPDWSRRFAPQREIQRYLEHCVDHFGLRPLLRLNWQVQRMQWQEHDKRWLITSAGGQQISARYVISAIGGLSRPAWPAIPGIDQFEGVITHSQQWNDELQLESQRVAVIGTGASAVQFIPEIAAKVAKLDVYQRTPNWILPRPDRALPSYLQRCYEAMPWLQKLVRFGIWLKAECRVPGLVWSNRLAFGHRWLARRHLKRQVPDLKLRSKLKPDYAIGCKRVLLSSNYYPALCLPQVELVDQPIQRIESNAIVTNDGLRRPADHLILATGFQATEPVPDGMVTGRDGQDLHQLWRHGPQAYKGTSVAGFPNLFMLLGPNTALGHNSVIVMIEAQIDYILHMLGGLDRQHAASSEIRCEAQARFNRHIQGRLNGSVWNQGGCGSWYLHPASGQNTTLWPDFTWQYRRLMRTVAWDDYVIESSN